MGSRTTLQPSQGPGASRTGLLISLLRWPGRGGPESAFHGGCSAFHTLQSTGAANVGSHSGEEPGQVWLGLGHSDPLAVGLPPSAPSPVPAMARIGQTRGAAGQRVWMAGAPRCSHLPCYLLDGCVPGTVLSQDCPGPGPHFRPTGGLPQPPPAQRLCKARQICTRELRWGSGCEPRNVARALHCQLRMALSSQPGTQMSGLST